MATTWEAEREQFEHHYDWHDKYFISVPSLVDWENSTVDLSVCKTCGSLVLAIGSAGTHLSDHRAWHDKIEGVE